MFQIKAGDQILFKAYPKQELALNSLAFEILYGGARGGGKLQPLSARILTPFGFKEVRAVEVGDVISDPVTGGTTTIIGVYSHPPQQIYRITFDDGASTEAGLEHLWAFKLPNHHRPRTKSSLQREYAIRELGQIPLQDRWNNFRVGDTAELKKYLDLGFRPRIPLCEPVAFSVNGRTGDGPPPYLLGTLLGDGHCQSKTITSCDDETRDYLVSLGFRPGTQIHTDGKPKDWRAAGPIRKQLDSWLRNHNLIKSRAWEKFIPAYVKTAGIEYRLEFLRGLMDTDGTVDDRGHCSFCSTSVSLAQDVQYLVRSLGGKAAITTKHPTYTYKGAKLDGREAYTVYIYLPKTSSLFKLSRKKARCVDRWNGDYENMRTVVSIEPTRIEEAKCIKVSSPYSLYITDDFIVTHNTACGMAWLLKGNGDQPTGSIADATYINHPGYRALVLRRNLTDMADWIAKARGFYAPLGGEFLVGQNEFRFGSGAVIVVGHMDSEDAFSKWQGQEFVRILWEEATQIQTLDAYLMVMSSCRTPYHIEMRKQIFLTANPGGPGSAWVSKRFVAASPPNTLFSDTPDGLSRIYIPARVSDNPAIASDPQYLQQLLMLPPAIRRAWLDGDWNALQGQAFEEFRLAPLTDEPPEACHVVQSASVPLAPWFPRWLACDWGYSHDAAVYKFCELPSTQVHVYDELVLSHTTPQELGAEIARFCWRELSLAKDEDRSMILYLSPDAFHKRTEERTIADQIASGINMILGPDSAFIPGPDEAPGDIFARAESAQGAAVIIKRASDQRVAGWMYCRSLMRWTPLVPDNDDRFDPVVALRLYQEDFKKFQEYLRLFQKRTEPLPGMLIHADKCPELLLAIPQARYQDPRKGDPNDVDKRHFKGMDCLDAWRYGLFSRTYTKVKEPFEAFMARRMEKTASVTDANSRVWIARKAEADYKKRDAPPMMDFHRSGVRKHRGTLNVR